MGKQGTRVSTRKAEKLIELYPDKFSSDFEQNKKVMAELKIPFTKTDRNIIAGRITSLLNQKED